VRFGKRTQRWAAAGRRILGDNREDRSGAVATEERNALLQPEPEDSSMPPEQPAPQEPMDSAAATEAPVTGDPTQKLLTALGRFQRQVAKAEGGASPRAWVDECMNQLIAGIEIAMASDWPDVKEALTDVARVLQSYEDAERAPDCIPFLQDSYEILCLMVGDLIVGNVRSGVMQKWRERYQHAVDELAKEGLSLVEDEEDTSAATAVAPADAPPVAESSGYENVTPFDNRRGRREPDFEADAGAGETESEAAATPFALPMDEAAMAPAKESPFETSGLDATVEPEWDPSDYFAAPETPSMDEGPAEGEVQTQGGIVEGPPDSDPEISCAFTEEPPAPAEEDLSWPDTAPEAPVDEPPEERAASLSPEDNQALLDSEEGFILEAYQGAEEPPAAAAPAAVEESAPIEEPTPVEESVAKEAGTFPPEAGAEETVADTAALFEEPPQTEPPAPAAERPVVEEVVEKPVPQSEPPAAESPVVEEPVPAAEPAAAEAPAAPAAETPVVEEPPAPAFEDGSPEALWQNAQQAMARGDMANAKVLALQVAADMARREAERAESDLEALKTELVENAQAIEAAEKALKQAESGVQEAEAARARHQTHVDQQRDHTGRLRDQIGEVEGAISEIDEQIRALQAKRQEEVERLEGVQTALREGMDEERRLESELEQAAGEETTAHESLGAAQSHIAELKESRTTQESQVREAEMRLERQRASAQDIERTIDQITGGPDTPDDGEMLF